MFLRHGDGKPRWEWIAAVLVLVTCALTIVATFVDIL
jgi:hypothetical protein